MKGIAYDETRFGQCLWSMNINKKQRAISEIS